MNIKDFNQVAEDSENVSYYSIGAHKPKLHSSDLLRNSHESVIGAFQTDSPGGIQSDGLVRPEEAKWGRYLMTFPEHDHLEMAGFNYEYQPYAVYNLIVDNLRVDEIKDSAKEAKEYGVDQYFRHPMHA